jgi:hypothetical protein
LEMTLKWIGWWLSWGTLYYVIQGGVWRSAVDGREIDETGLDGRAEGRVNWIELMWLKVAGCCEHGNAPVGSIKCGEIVERLRNCQLLK